MEEFLVKMKIPSQPSPPNMSLSERMQEQYRREVDEAKARAQATPPDDELRKRAQEYVEMREQEENDALDEDQRRTQQNSPPPVKRNADGSVALESLEPNEIRYRVMYVEDEESGVIPERTDELCLWDMQPFTGVPFPIPLRYDTTENAFWVLGWACSLSCALAYIDHNYDTLYTANGSNLVKHTIMLAKDYYKASWSPRLTLRAPPREKLSYLHAKFTQQGSEKPMIDALHEFRNGSEDIIYHAHPAPPFIRVTRRFDEEILRKKQDEEHEERIQTMAQKPVPIACTKRGMVEQRKYVLKRRRDGAKKKRGTLDSLLGV